MEDRTEAYNLTTIKVTTTNKKCATLLKMQSLTQQHRAYHYRRGCLNVISQLAAAAASRAQDDALLRRSRALIASTSRFLYTIHSPSVPFPRNSYLKSNRRRSLNKILNLAGANNELSCNFENFPASRSNSICVSRACDICHNLYSSDICVQNFLDKFLQHSHTNSVSNQSIFDADIKHLLSSLNKISNGSSHKISKKLKKTNLVELSTRLQPNSYNSTQQMNMSTQCKLSTIRQEEADANSMTTIRLGGSTIPVEQVVENDDDNTVTVLIGCNKNATKSDDDDVSNRDENVQEFQVDLGQSVSASVVLSNKHASSSESENTDYMVSSQALYCKFICNYFLLFLL